MGAGCTCLNGPVFVTRGVKNEDLSVNFIVFCMGASKALPVVHSAFIIGTY